MLNIDKFRVYSTERGGNVNWGIFVGFDAPRKAADKYRFTHARTGTILRVFVDDEKLPIGMDFRGVPPLLNAKDDGNRERSEVIAQRLYAFALYMVDFGDRELRRRRAREFTLSDFDSFNEAMTRAEKAAISARAA